MKRALVLGFVAFAAGCATDVTTHTNVVFTRPAAAGETIYYSFPIRSGQILLSESFGAHALLFGLGTKRFYRFTHAALLMVEDGAPFVYEFSGEFKPTFAKTPPESIRGGLHRTPFLEYVKQHVFVEVFDPPRDADPSRMVAKVAELRIHAPDFDPYWHWGEDRYYCTEFVAAVNKAAGGQIPALVPVTPNPSLRTLLAWFGLHDETTLPAGAFEDPTREVAAFSIWPTRTAVDAFFAAKAEVHRRFTIDQKVGDVFVLDGHEITMRPAVAAFLDRAPHLFDHAAKAPSADEIARAVDALAVESFGEFPSAQGSTSARTGTTSTSGPGG